MQAVIAVTYMVLNGLYWAISLLPKKWFWDLSRYEWRDITPDYYRDAAASEHSYTRSLWYAIQATGDIAWVTSSGAAPKGKLWKDWLKSAYANRQNPKWDAVAEKDRLFSGEYSENKSQIEEPTILPTDKRRYDSAQWHSDIQFEPVPADYTSLRLTELPTTGGDTLWASGYEIYDRFSRKYQEFFESLTATFTGDAFLRAAERSPTKVKIYDEPRGNPLNTGDVLTAIHPVVRTNPVTGWKSIFAIGPFPKYINELSPTESDELLKKFHSVIIENHDLQLRFKWRNKNDIAIWDNRSVFHSATFDYDGLGERFGHGAVRIGEKPYLDPNSMSRTEALAASGLQVS
ncbi:hypothetical protein DTO166G5_6472 [Paecilomyces variotii]|nr:hypothetical protein DTO166G5_6472 [Paecilomyces variotii]